jgi:hypothetical protein
MALKWTNTSCDPSSGAMKPNPFRGSYHLTRPVCVEKQSAAAGPPRPHPRPAADGPAITRLWTREAEDPAVRDDDDAAVLAARSTDDNMIDRESSREQA